MSSLTHQPPTALVTGATSGLGKAIAVRLARDGLQVVVVGRDASRGAAVVAQIEAAGGQARFIAADLNDLADIKRLAEGVGDIDVLVNNAGRSVWAPTEDMRVADFDSMFASNVRAPYLLVGAFAPAMAERGTGVIINITSMAGRIGLRSGAAYRATKAALDSMTQSWTAEYCPRGVRVNSVAAGPIHTRVEARERFDQLGATTARQNPLRLPKSSPSSRRLRRATLLAPSSQPTVVGRPSDAHWHKPAELQPTGK